MREFRMVSTSGILGYGYPEASLNAALERGVDMIGCDGGSSDPGPYYLGSGKPFVSLRAMKRDLRLMLIAAIRHRVPMVIGTCGGAGGEPHLRIVAQMVRDIARDEGLHFNLALIHAEQDKALIRRRIAEGRTKPLGRMAPARCRDGRARHPHRRHVRAGALYAGARPGRPGRARRPQQRPRPLRRQCHAGAAAARPRPGTPARCWNAAPPRPCRRGRTACM